MRRTISNSKSLACVRLRSIVSGTMIFGWLAVCPLSALAWQQTGGAALAGSDWDKRASHGAGISGREAFASVVFDSDGDGQQEMWVFGGAHGSGLRDFKMVEFSTIGTPWWEVSPEPPWSPRSHFSAVVFDGKVWLFAGRGSTTSDVWYSADCATWTQAPDAPWAWREGYEVQVFNGKIWLMGGHDGQTKFKDVWSFDGTTWTHESDAPWTGRDGFSSAVLSCELYVIGGRGNDGTNDIVLSGVWKTSDGVTWTEATSIMDLGPRREHSTVVFDDRIWVIGGNVSLVDNDDDPNPTSKMDDVWWSFDGATWTASAEFGESPWHRSMSHESLVFTPAVWFDAVNAFQEFPRIWILGGRTQTTYERQTVWSDRRDHELVTYNPEAIGLPINIKSPNGNQTERITESTITLTDQNILITDLNVSFDMTHTNWEDIRMRLVHFYTDENGVEQEIRGQFIAPGYGVLTGNGRVEVTLEDDLSIPWLNGNVPIIGEARFPNTYWDQFYGQPANGTWTLWIKDVVKHNDGRLDSWSLELRGMPVPSSPGITVTPSNGLTTTEAGGTDSFDVVLDTQPTADVTIGISSDNTAEGTVNLTSLTFTSANWDTPQTVNVTGQDDATEDGDIAYTIVTDAATSTDTDYNGLDADDVSVTNQDDEQAPTLTYNSTDTPLAIPDPGTITSTIDVAVDFAITDLNVTLNIDHDRAADMDVFLIAPDGTRVELFTDVGGNGNDFIDTTLDDQAATSITDGSPPFTGSFRPEGNLGDFNTSSTLGTWTLEVTDDRAVGGQNAAGTLLNWSFTVETL